MGMLKIERIGGFGGFGLPGSKLESSGEQAMSALSAADQASVEALFKNPKRVSVSQKERTRAPHKFTIKITRTINDQKQTVEVPEEVVPEALKACLTDKLR